MQSSNSNGEVAAGRPALRVGRWRVDASADEIEADGRVVKLEPQNMRLLLTLAERPGQVVTTQELLDRVWRDLIVTPNSVYQAVAQLRKQLGDPADEPEYIQTVHRKGYRLIAEVREDSAVPSAVPSVAVAPLELPAASPLPAKVPETETETATETATEAAMAEATVATIAATRASPSTRQPSRAS